MHHSSTIELLLLILLFVTGSLCTSLFSTSCTTMGWEWQKNWLELERNLTRWSFKTGLWVTSANFFVWSEHTLIQSPLCNLFLILAGMFAGKVLFLSVYNHLLEFRYDLIILSEISLSRVALEETHIHLKCHNCWLWVILVGCFCFCCCWVDLRLNWESYLMTINVLFLIYHLYVYSNITVEMK